MGMTKIASRIIARFGQSGAIVRPVVMDDSVHPPTLGTPTTHPATIAVIDWDARDRDGTNIRADDLRILVSTEGLAIEPENTDRLTVGGRTYSIVRVSKIAPDGVVRIYDVQVRA